MRGGSLYEGLSIGQTILLLEETFAFSFLKQPNGWSNKAVKVVYLNPVLLSTHWFTWIPRCYLTNAENATPCCETKIWGDSAWSVPLSIICSLFVDLSPRWLQVMKFDWLRSWRSSVSNMFCIQCKSIYSAQPHYRCRRESGTWQRCCFFRPPLFRTRRTSIS